MKPVKAVSVNLSLFELHINILNQKRNDNNLPQFGAVDKAAPKPLKIKSTDFRDWLNNVCAEVFDVPEGAFKESGTMIRTKIIKVHK